jgi:hypothetical protein
LDVNLGRVGCKRLDGTMHGQKSTDTLKIRFQVRIDFQMFLKRPKCERLKVLD